MFKYKVLIGPLPAKVFNPTRLRAVLSDVDGGYINLSFTSEEQLRDHYPKSTFPDLVSGQIVESPNGQKTTYYSLLIRDEKQNQWVSATSDPR